MTAQVRLIPLPKGEVLELTIHPGFLERVRKHFGMAPDQDVDDEHLRMFVYGAFKNAIDKVDNGTP